MDRSLVLALTLPLAGLSLAAAPEPPRAAPPGAAKLILDATDVILSHQINPPTRQQMIADGIAAVYAEAGTTPPAGLGRRLSALAERAPLEALIEETWPCSPTTKSATSESLTHAFLQGLTVAIPEGAMLLTAEQARVDAQVQGNLYVGIHVALSFHDEEKRPSMSVIPGGPADRAGARERDLIEEIDGNDMRGQGITEAVRRLRGEEGTTVEVKVRQPKSTEVRTLRITRGRLMRPTIEGFRDRDDGSPVVRIDGPDPIGYLQFRTIAGSTPHELRKWARQLESEGVRALILDLRSSFEANLRPTVLVADALLESGTIGRVRTADGITTHEAEPDALFRGWPLAVLIGKNTEGSAEWLAAALQDNHRAVLVGAGPTAGVATVQTAVPIADGSWAIEMVTGILERGDGRLIDRPRPDGRSPRARLPRLRHGTAGVPADASSDDGPGRVRPDHLVPELVVRPPAGAVEADVERDLRTRDPVRLKAVRLLREMLKSS